MGRNAGGYCAQNDAYETDQTSNDIWGRNVGYNEAKRKWYSGKRDENDKVDVRSDTQRQDLERHTELRGTTRVVQASKKITERISNW